MGKLKKDRRRKRPSIPSPSRVRLIFNCVAGVSVVAAGLIAAQPYIPSLAAMNDLIVSAQHSDITVAKLPPPVPEHKALSVRPPVAAGQVTIDDWHQFDAASPNASVAPLPIGAPIAMARTVESIGLPGTKGEGTTKAKPKAKDSAQTLDAKNSSLMLHDQGDESEASKSTSKPIASTATAVPVAPVTQSKPTDPPSNRSAANDVNSRKPLTIVDIARDGTYVLITNPETRLPQQFKVGQRIFTGEVISQINPKSGQFVTDQRTVNLQ